MKILKNHKTRLATASGTLAVVGKTNYFEDLPGALVARGLKRNLISVAKLCKDNGKSYVHNTDGVYEIENKHCKIEKGIKIANLKNNLYEYIENKNSNPIAMHVENPNRKKSLVQLIHERFGHKNVSAILRGIRQGYIKHGGLEQLDDANMKRLMKEATHFTCIACGLGKHKATPARRQNQDPALRVGDITYADACVPVKPYVKTPNGKAITGWMLTVDAKSSYCMTEDICNKGDSGQILYDMLAPLAPALPKHKDHATLRVIVPDQCQELKTNATRRLMNKVGFFITPSASKHRNGLARLDERMRHITEITRVLMLQKTINGKNIPAEEHIFARRHAVEIINRLPINGGKSPYQRFWNKIPDISYMRTFYAPLFVKLYNGKERVKSERYTAVAYIGFYLGMAPGGRGHLVRRPGYTDPFVRHDTCFLEDLPNDIPIRNIIDEEMQKILTRNKPRQYLSLDGYTETIPGWEQIPEEHNFLISESVHPQQKFTESHLKQEKEQNDRHTEGQQDFKLENKHKSMSTPESRETVARRVSFGNSETKSFDTSEVVNQPGSPQQNVADKSPILRTTTKSDDATTHQWSVDKILDHRYEPDGSMSYKVDWTGEFKPTWEPENNCEGCPEVVREYHIKRGPHSHDAHTASQIVYKTPKTYKEATTGPDAEEWKASIQAEYKNMEAHKAWIPAEAKGGEKIINTILGFRNKLDCDGNLEKRKTRLCLDGRHQIEGRDYKESHAPTCPQEIMRLILCLATMALLIVTQFDFDGAFLNANGEEGVVLFMRPPPGYIMPRGYEHCTLLRILKAIYGGKASGYLWYNHLKADLESRGFVECPSAKCLFVRPGSTAEEDPTIIFIHVDDGLIFHNNQEIIDETLNSIDKKLSLTKEDLNWHLGVKMENTKDHLKMSVPSYIDQLSSRFGLSEANPKRTPLNPSTIYEKNTGEKFQCPYQEAIGALIWPSLTCRPDITQAVNLLSRYTSNPSKTHWMGVKRVIAYLKTTKEKGIVYRKPSVKRNLLDVLKNARLVIYSDSDYAGDPDGRRSTSGFAIYLTTELPGSKVPEQPDGCLVDWGSYRQPVTAQSTCEAEMIAGVRAAKRGRYHKKVLDEVLAIALKGKDFMDLLLDTKSRPSSIEVHFPSELTSIIKMDNQAAVTVCKTGNFQKRLKHMDVRYYYLAQEVGAKRVIIKHTPGTTNPADIFTKAVSVDTFTNLIKRLVN